MGILLDIFSVLVRFDYLFNVLGLESVLILGFFKLTRGVDEKNISGLSVFLEDQDRSGNARSIEDVGRQPDYGIEVILIDDRFPDDAFSSSAEQNAMG